MNPASPGGRRLEWLGTAIVAALGLWYWLQFFTRSTNLLDEGSTAAQAMRVLRGELIYRDFFTVVTPGSYYTVAALFRMFGEHLIVLRWSALVTGIGILLATMVVTRRLTSWPFAAGAGLLTTVWGWFLVTPNFYSLEAALLALVALAVYIHGATTPRWVFTAGVCVGLTALVKQNVGAYTAVALFASIWASAFTDDRWHARDRIRRSAVFAGGILLPVVPTLIWLVASGAGPYLYESWVYYPLAKYTQRFSLPYPPMPSASDVAGVISGRIAEPSNYDVWTQVVLHLPTIIYPLLFIAGVWHYVSHRSRQADDPSTQQRRHAVIAVTLAGICSLLTAWPRADTTHILFGIQPTFVLLAYTLSRLVPSGTTGVWRTMATAGALLPIVLLLWIGYNRTHWEYQNYVAGLHVDRGRGIATQFLEAQRIDNVTKYIVEHTTKDDHIFVVPWASGFYFLADRPNATRTDFMLFEDPEAYPCLLARLDQRPPKYVIYGYTWDVDNKRFRDYAAPVDQYIRSRYAIEFTTDGYEIWRRLSDTTPAASYTSSCQPRAFRWRDLMK